MINIIIILVLIIIGLTIHIVNLYDCIEYLIERNKKKENELNELRTRIFLIKMKKWQHKN